MSTDNDGPALARIGGRRPGTFHGPVEVKRQPGDVQVVTFVGSEESDVLHAAGAWMGEHPYAVLIGINWYGDFLSPYDDADGDDGPPRHRMDLTVDVFNEPTEQD